MYSGDAIYIFRPPTSRGSPAFGMAVSGRVTTLASCSMASSTPCGPTEQLTPTASTPIASIAGPKSDGAVPK